MSEPEQVSATVDEVLATLYSAWDNPEIQRRMAEQERRETRIYRAELRARLRRALLRSALPECPLPRDDVHRVLEGEVEETPPVRAARRFMERPDLRFLVLLGAVGTGKSIAAAEACAWRRRAECARILADLDAMPAPLAAAEDALERAKNYRMGASWVPATQLARRWEPWQADLEAGVTRLPRGGTLVLDDLGTERDSERFHAAFGELVELAQARGKTIITTNLARGDIRDRYGDRIADRLNHSGVAVPVLGSSRRRKGEL